MLGQVLVKPIITERSLLDASHGIFTFMVGKGSDKNIIKKEVEKQFNVHVQRISTIKMTGKKRLVGKRRTKVSEANWKKARVELRNGEKIDLFETEAKKA